MRDETIRKVLDFPLPTRVKQLSSFIGLVQYFRNHIYADYSSPPIYLLTDTSDYGIGGYLYQLVDESERLVAFVSKSLTGPQLRWPTI